MGIPFWNSCIVPHKSSWHPCCFSRPAFSHVSVWVSCLLLLVPGYHLCSAHLQLRSTIWLQGEVRSMPTTSDPRHDSSTPSDTEHYFVWIRQKKLLAMIGAPNIFVHPTPNPFKTFLDKRPHTLGNGLACNINFFWLAFHNETKRKTILRAKRFTCSRYFVHWNPPKRCRTPMARMTIKTSLLHIHKYPPSFGCDSPTDA